MKATVRSHGERLPREPPRGPAPGPGAALCGLNAGRPCRGQQPPASPGKNLASFALSAWGMEKGMDATRRRRERAEVNPGPESELQATAFLAHVQPQLVRKKKEQKHFFYAPNLCPPS